MSDISSLEAELNRQRSINRELQSELSMIASGVNSAYDRLEAYNGKICSALDTSRSMLDASENRMEAALEVQGEIERLYVRFKAMELANKRIRECNNRKYYDFANYRTVRKIVQGMMDNLDIHMVSDEVIYKSVEESHLKTPDYWLTGVLLSVMAWKNDDRELAERSMTIAMELDKKSSAIFYMLFNLRMRREDAALKWFQQYQQCELKGADQRTFLLLFSLISKTINQSEELSPRSREEIDAFIRQVVERTANAQGYSREQMIDRIQEHLSRMVPREQPDYPMLRKHCADYKRLAAVLMQAKANIPLLEFFKSVLHVQPEERNVFLKGFVDELILQANSQEKEVYEEISYNETIIRMEGDVDRAKQEFGARKVHDEKELNLVAEMIDWVYGADRQDVNGQSRLSMYILTRDLHREALKRRAEAYRSCDRSHGSTTIADYTTSMDFNDERGECAKATAFFQKKRDGILAGLKNLKAYLGFGVGAAAAVGAIAAQTYILLALTLLGAGYGGVVMLKNRSAARQAEAQCQTDSQMACQTIAELCREYAAYEKEYQSYDAYDQLLRQELEDN